MRDQLKEIMLRLRINLTLRKMTEVEALIFWQDYLDDLEAVGVTPEILEKACAKCRREPGRVFFPTVGELVPHIRAVKDAQSVSRPSKVSALPKPDKWTQQGLDRARAALQEVPDSSPFKGLLSRIVETKEGKNDQH